MRNSRLLNRLLYMKHITTSLANALAEGAREEFIQDEFDTALSVLDCDNICLDCFKGMYFCERSLNHDGDHCDGGLIWE